MRRGIRPSESLSSNLEAVKAVIARYPVSNPRLFGSVARGEDDDTSDVDLLVDPLATTSFFDLADLEFELETLLGVAVDVATPGGLAPDVKARVLADLRPLT